MHRQEVVHFSITLLGRTFWQDDEGPIDHSRLIAEEGKLVRLERSENDTEKTKQKLKEP